MGMPLGGGLLVESHDFLCFVFASSPAAGRTASCWCYTSVRGHPTDKDHWSSQAARDVFVQCAYLIKVIQWD